MPEITLHFPDDDALTQFGRWWALHGREPCLLFIRRTVDDAPARYLHAQPAPDDPSRWMFTWDDIPF